MGSAILSKRKASSQVFYTVSSWPSSSLFVSINGVIDSQWLAISNGKVLDICS